MQSVTEDYNRAMVNREATGSRERRKITVPIDSEEARSFYQERLAQFARLVTLLSGGFFLLGNALELLLQDNYSLSMLFEHSGNAWHLVGIGLSAVLWLATRHIRFNAKQLIGLDVGGAITINAAYMMMGAHGGHVPDVMHARLDLVLALTSMILQMTRAVMVPSTAGRTVIVGVGSALPLLYVSYLLAVQVHRTTPTLSVYMSVTYVALWCATTIIPAALASRVIYGLREQVREALQLGQYTLEERIGEGGMGTVYRARHAMLRRPTAIKLLPPDKAGAHALARFEREVQLTSCLTHPNTVAIYDYGRTADGVFYYAMEYLDGIDLQRLVDLEGPQDPARVVHILLQVCGALAEAHELGLVHRDIKPANIILANRGGSRDVAKVVDFGLVKDLAERSDDPALSTVHGIVGTPLFLTPEAIQSPANVDARSDLYALGAVAYFLLTGTPVFSGSTLVEVCSHHLLTPPEPPSARLGRPLPIALERLVLRCLAKKPEDRPQSARELKKLLAACEIKPWEEQQAEEAYQRLEVEKRAVKTAPARVQGQSETQLTIDLRMRAARAAG